MPPLHDDVDPSTWETPQSQEQQLFGAIERAAVAAQARCPRAHAEIVRRVASLRRRLKTIERDHRQLRALGFPREVTRGR